MHQDGYSNLQKIGEGGMAIVYRGIQESLNRPVAIKVLTQDLGEDDEARRRFERESYIIARLNHPSIIHVIDKGINNEGMPFFVMEYVEGIDLGTAAKGNRLDHGDKIEIIIQLLKALSYAHRNNVIHRDIKPDNILVDEDRNVKVLDFGIAQFYDEHLKVGEHTTSGTVMGTYNYMSPEQRESSENVTERSDLYSVGVIMYELFTGRIPSGHFPAPQKMNPEVNNELSELILQCLNPEPKQRPATASELKNHLLRAVQGAHIGSDQKQRAEQGISKNKARFQLLDVLREDKYGAVYLYQQKERGNLLVIKKKVISSSGYETNNILSSLQHPNIVSTLGTSKNDRFFILVQEYLNGGNLQDKLAYQLNWQQTVKIAKQICEAMLFAHNNRVMHGNLRPSNILFTDEGDVKITDFDLQDEIAEIENAHHYCQKGEERSQAGDIYTVGVILYQLLTGCLPNRQQDSRYAVRKSFTKLPEDIQDLIKSMLFSNPQKRRGDSLATAIGIFNKQINQQDRNLERDTALPMSSRGLTRESDTIILPPPDASHKSGTSFKHFALLFGLFLVGLSQFLFQLDGPELIKEHMPAVYEVFTGTLDTLLGKNDA